MTGSKSLGDIGFLLLFFFKVCHNHNYLVTLGILISNLKKISMNQPSIGPGLDDHCSDGEVFLAVGIFRFSQCPEFWGEHVPFVKKYLCGNSFGC